MSDQDRDGRPGKPSWQAGKTFFEESGGEPAIAVGGEDRATDQGDVHLPASEADEQALKDETGDAPQSWPGKGFGSIPPPG